MNAIQFADELEKQGIMLSERQIEQFRIYFKTLVEWNEKINLTALTDEEDVYLKHFYDSISAAFYHDFTKEQRICDVGAGAGFPSLPIKICFPHINVTIVDSLQKRIGFLNHLATQLELNDVAFYHDRAETFGKNATFRESYDTVMARAVARMSVLSELCLPLVKKNGTFIAMKGSQAKEEVDEAKSAIEVLGGKVSSFHTFSLPEENSERSIILIAKNRQTPKKYPRKPGTPNKEPIQ
ncbi:16S rRNA (guanine(527)-N(7))-methyltransferase RsmG [Ornithinibacillus bavariensis]|uniref:16S rRNA (guanine(527)-N(7))-methyltransferase RsmG n=1 Tax=Ornithinibacillus bavariensis TaxID=545502 RepID=UPI003D1D2364